MATSSPDNLLARVAGVRQGGSVTHSRAVREIGAEDADSVLEVVAICELAESGELTYTVEEIHSDLATDGVRSAGIDHPGGGLAAYLSVERRTALRIVEAQIFVRPGSDPSVAAAALAWVQASAAELGPGLPVHVSTGVGNAMMRGLFEKAGGSVVRRYFRMVVSLDGIPRSPALAEGVEVRGIHGEHDLRAMHRVVETAFGDHYAHEPREFEEWRRSSVEGACRDPDLWWLATVDQQPAAGIYGFALPDAGYIDTLGTLREFRGRGLGRALLLTAFAAFRARGLRKVFLGVDATNPTGAVSLYASVGMVVDHEGWRYELPA